MAPKNNKSPEHGLSPELTRKIHDRWGIVYRAVEAQRAQTRTDYPDLSEAPVEAPKQRDDTAPIAGNVIDLTVRQEARELSDQERRIAEAQQAAREA